MERDEWVWSRLSDETKLSIFYLENLWGDTRFQQDWNHLRDTYGVIRSFELRMTAFTEQGEASNATASNCLAGGFSRLKKGLTTESSQVFETLARNWHIPNRIRSALCRFLTADFPEPVNPTALCAAAAAYCSCRVEKIPQGAVLRSELNDLALAVFFLVNDDLHASAECPIPCLKSPTVSEPKHKYLEWIRDILRAEADFYARRSKGNAIEWLERVLGYQFRAPRNAIPAILALAEDYYEKCAATQGTQVSNRSDETLRRYARVVYLNLVKGRTLGQIAAELKLPRSTVQDALESGMKLLGLEKPPKSVRNR